MKILLFILLLLPAIACAGDVNLRWDTITDTAVTKVNIYQSTSATAVKPWTLKTSVNMPSTNATFNVPTGAYFWYATAAASATLESVPSNIVTGDVSPNAPTIYLTIPK
jgi:hypothetical protein